MTTFAVSDRCLTVQFIGDDDDRETLRELTNERGGTAALNEALGRPMANGPFEFLDASEIGALTDAPIIGYESTRDDQGNLTDAGKVFWFPNYAVECPVETLLTTGKVEFTAAP